MPMRLVRATSCAYSESIMLARIKKRTPSRTDPSTRASHASATAAEGMPGTTSSSGTGQASRGAKSAMTQ